MSKIVLVFAIDESNLVGNNNMPYGLPWHYKDDLLFYKEKTMNKTVIMGRETYDAIGKALPNRKTYVLSRQNLKLDDSIVINDYRDVFKLDDDEIIISGGVSVYELFLPYADEIYLTRINKTYSGDVYFESLDLSDFVLVESNKMLEGELDFQKWERNANFRSRNTDV